MHKLRVALIFAVVLSILPSAMAQPARGTVSGIAKDSGGSVLQGARVQLDPSGQQAVTDGQGQFRLPDVATGDYTLTISYVGLATFTQNIKLAAGQTANVDATLQVASQSDSVVVTAERVSGEAEAINIERTADNIVQVLPSKVITSLPNTNIADAVGRAPSVTLERDEGEGKYVQIRGTEPRLSNVTVNGVHLPSPEGQVRNIKLDAVPSDVVDRIEVNKTLSANQDGDAIGGSVNLVTKSALEKPTWDFAAQGGYTPIQGGRTLDGFSGTIGQRLLADKKLGLLFGGTFDLNNRGINDAEPTQAIGTLNGANFAYISSEDLRTYQYYRTRLGFDGEADYTFKPGARMYVRGFYSDFHDDGDVWVYTPNAGAYVSHSGSQTTFDNTGNMQFRQYVRRPDQGVFSYVTGANYSLSPTTILSYQFAVSRAHNYGGQDFPTTNFNGPSATFALTEADPYRPKLFPTDGTNVIDPAGYSIANTSVTNYQSYQLDFEGSMALSKSYTIGSHYSTFEMGFQGRDAHKKQNENDFFYDAVNTYTMDQLRGTHSNASYYDNSFIPLGPFTDYTKIRSVIAGGIANGGFTPNLNSDRLRSDPATWDTSERIWAGYLMDTISFGKLRLQGGLRIESTASNYLANKVTLNGGSYVGTTPVTGTSSYVNFMPSIQAQYLLEKNTNLRLSYGRGISRPNFTDIVPSVQVDPNASPKSIQQGNPLLKPTRANNYDVLIEHYFQPLGILQGGYFYKGLTNPIYPTASFVPASDPNFAGYLLQQSINGPSAHIAGVEMAWQQRMSFLPGMLSGFGVAANYSYTTSRVTFPDGFSSAVAGGQGRIDHPSLQRQAPNTWNLGLTYDKNRFSMRFGVSHNDANIYAYQYVHDPTVSNVDADPILGIKGPLGDQYLYAHTQYDIQGSYRFYRGLEVMVSGLNLSNEVFGFYTGSSIYPNQREYYHPTIIVGMRWISAAER